ncbi:MAG: OmpH family outer membrane protein [Bacteroidetes bacterium]|jgi:outer membrane protein|nr:OmpH family outer membrane protein [Bacteroidota bacterium]
MKNIAKLVVVSAVVLMSSFTANAQKIAHIDLDSLISIMPESKTAQQAVQDYAKQLEQQVIAMQTELQEKYEKYQAESANLAPIIKTNREKELNDLNQRIQDFQQQAQADYQNKSAELSKPVYDKAKKAIDQVAKENGYKYVLDTSTGLVLYTEPTEDIIGLVVKKLGITFPAKTTTPAPTPAPAPKK